MVSHPILRQVVLDTTAPRALAEFYRQVLGLDYRPGDEPPAEGPDEPDWLNLQTRDGRPMLAFQLVETLTKPTWPSDEVPQQLHLDMAVPSLPDLRTQHERILGLGATMLLDRTDHPEEPLYVYADPSGHPFCVFVG